MNKTVKAHIKAHEDHIIDSANLVLGLIEKEHLPYITDAKARKYAVGVRKDLSNQIKNLRKKVSIQGDELLASEFDVSKLTVRVDQQAKLFRDINLSLDYIQYDLNDPDGRIAKMSEMHNNLGSKVYGIDSKLLATAEYAKAEIADLRSSIACLYAIVIGLAITTVTLAIFY